MLQAAFMLAYNTLPGDIFQHTLRVVGLLPLGFVAASWFEKLQTIAMLHDVVEDTDVTLEQLGSMGFDYEVVAAVDALTRREDEPYLTVYLPRVKKNTLAKLVKLADLDDHVRQVETLPDNLRPRYEKALAFLED